MNVFLSTNIILLCALAALIGWILLRELPAWNSNPYRYLAVAQLKRTGFITGLILCFLFQMALAYYASRHDGMGKPFQRFLFSQLGTLALITESLIIIFWIRAFYDETVSDYIPGHSVALTFFWSLVLLLFGLSVVTALFQHFSPSAVHVKVVTHLQGLLLSFLISFATVTFFMSCEVRGLNILRTLTWGCFTNVLIWGVYFALFHFFGPPVSDILAGRLYTPESYRMEAVVTLYAILLMLLSYYYYKDLLRRDALVWIVPSEEETPHHKGSIQL